MSCVSQNCFSPLESASRTEQLLLSLHSHLYTSLHAFPIGSYPKCNILESLSLAQTIFKSLSSITNPALSASTTLFRILSILSFEISGCITIYSLYKHFIEFDIFYCTSFP